MNNVKGSLVLLPANDDTDAAIVVASSDHADVANIELGKVSDLASGQVQDDSVVDLKMLPP